MRYRCDVRHHVQRRELLPNAGDARFDRPRVSEVELNPVHARMRGRDRLEQRPPPTCDDHVIAAEVELLGEGTPDAARAAGDEDRVVAEPHASTASCSALVPHTHRSFWMWLDGRKLAVLFAGKRLINTERVDDATTR
jgi:hypothetical protein